MFELSRLDGSVLTFEEWPLAKVMAGEVLTDYEVCLRRIDRDWQAIFSYGGSIVKAPNGQPLAFLTITDITKRKRIEAKLKIYSDKLERSNSELQDFAQIASHDLQEPLRKILAFGDRLKVKAGESLDGECRDYLQRMFNAAARMQTLITDLMTFSRVETKAQTFVAVDLGVIAREVSADLETLIEKSGGRVEIEELPTIDADPVQMRQLLQNLISNSLKYCRAGVPPVVRIYSQEPDEHRRESLTKTGGLARQLTEILVKDNGIGFDEKYLDRIFNMFQRLHQKGEYEGTGVGLAICRKIVDRHSGTITAHSSPGQGTTFMVTMPVMQPKEVEGL
jgi:light-regulated signal transduction histidine kinase (bacteriophytochrome)